MRFELKTQNDNHSQLFPHFLVIFIFALIIVLCNVAIKLGIISRHYKIEYNCRLLSVKQSNLHFEKLSKLSNLKSKQQIWEFCREIIK